MQTELSDFHYREPGEILHVFGLMLKLSDVGLIAGDRDSVLAQAKTYIDNLRQRADLPVLKRDHFMEDIRHGAWGGLGITETGSPQYSELFSYLHEQRNLAKADTLPGLAEKLMGDIASDTDLFCRSLVGNSSDMIDGPVLAHLSPTAFLDAVQSQSAGSQFRIFQCINSRHSRGSLIRDWPEERPWVQALHKLMLDRVASADPLQRHKLTEFAGWIGASIKEAKQSEAESSGAAASEETASSSQ